MNAQGLAQQLGQRASHEDYSRILQSISADIVCRDFASLVDCRVFLTPFLVSGAVGCLLTGVIVSQANAYTWLYYIRGFRQRGILILVWVCTAFQIVSAVADCARLVEIFGNGFGSYTQFVKPKKADAVAYFANTACQVLTQLFLLYRAWLFSVVKARGPRQRLLLRCTLVLILALIAISSAASLAVSIEIQRINNYMLLAYRTHITRFYDLAMPLWLAPSTFVDGTLAAVIFWELYLPKSERSGQYTALHHRLVMFLRIIAQSGIVLAGLQLSVLCYWQYQLSQSSPLRWTSWGYLPQTALARYYTITLLLICTLPYAKKVKPPSPSLSTHSTPAEIIFTQGSSVLAERRLSSRAVAELENDITRREGLAKREKRARVDAGLDSPESAMGFEIIGFPHSPGSRSARDYGNKELEAGDYWAEIERDVQRGKARHERKMLGLAVTIPKAPPVAAGVQRATETSHGWKSHEATRIVRKLATKGKSSPPSPKVYRSASTPAFLSGAGKGSVLSFRRPDTKESDFDIQLEQVKSAPYAAALPAAPVYEAESSYQPCFTYRPSVLPAPDPPRPALKQDVQSLSEALADAPQVKPRSKTTASRTSDAASRALMPEASARKKAPRDDISRAAGSGTVSVSSLISHYIQTRSNASIDSPISNLEVLERYSAVPAVHLASAAAFSSPPPVFTPTSSTSFFTATTTQASPSRKLASSAESPKVSMEPSPRAQFFSQVANSQLKLSFPPSPDAPASAQGSPTDAPLPSPMQSGAETPLGSYRFGKDFSSPPVSAISTQTGSALADALDLSRGRVTSSGPQAALLRRRSSSGFRPDAASNLRDRQDSGTTTSLELPTPLNSRFSVESSVFEGQTSDREEETGVAS